MDADVLSTLLSGGPLGAVVVFLFWRLWKVSDRERETLINTITENTRAIELLAVRIEAMCNKVKD